MNHCNIFSGIELSPDSSIAMIELDTMDRHSALRIESILDMGL